VVSALFTSTPTKKIPTRKHDRRKRRRKWWSPLCTSQPWAFFLQTLPQLSSCPLTSFQSKRIPSLSASLPPRLIYNSTRGQRLRYKQDLSDFPIVQPIARPGCFSSISDLMMMLILKKYFPHTFLYNERMAISREEKLQSRKK
jgi:hypothetical protein